MIFWPRHSWCWTCWFSLVTSTWSPTNRRRQRFHPGFFCHVLYTLSNRIITKSKECVGVNSKSILVSANQSSTFFILEKTTPPIPTIFSQILSRHVFPGSWYLSHLHRFADMFHYANTPTTRLWQDARPRRRPPPRRQWTWRRCPSLIRFAMGSPFGSPCVDAHTIHFQAQDIVGGCWGGERWQGVTMLP